MAMIICPQCGKEFSGKAAACPRCGYVPEKKEEIILISCDECGTEFDSRLDACPNCGCPKTEPKVESTPQKVEVTRVAVNKKKLIISIVVIVAVVATLIGGFFIKQNIDESTYYDNMKTANSLMLTGCAKAESTAGLIHDVWRNAINKDYDDKTDKYTRPDGYFVSDFNDALANLWVDSGFTEDVASITANQSSVQEIMKDLKNPPDKYSEAYSDLKEFYDVYLKFTNLAIDPSGSLTSYTQDYNELDSDAMSKYDKMKLHLD